MNGGGTDPTELLSAHLACFAWRTPAAAKGVLHSARHRAAQRGFPALFVSVDARDAGTLDEAAGGSVLSRAAATVYGVNLPAGLRWSISSSEI